MSMNNNDKYLAQVDILERVLYRLKEEKLWDGYNLVWKMLCDWEDTMMISPVPQDIPEPLEGYDEDEFDYIYGDEDDGHPSPGGDYWQNDAGEWRLG